MDSVNSTDSSHEAKNTPGHGRLQGARPERWKGPAAAATRPFDPVRVRTPGGCQGALGCYLSRKPPSLMAAWAAASRATGMRNGEQET